MGIFEIKIYVNVYRFLRKYSAFYIFDGPFFSVFISAVSGVEGTKKSAISGTLLNEDGDIAL